MLFRSFATAVQYDLPIIVVVIDNGMYGTIRMHQERRYPGRVSATSLRNPDFAALARAYGGHGESVLTTADFALAFERAVASGKPSILHVKVDPEGYQLADVYAKQGEVATLKQKKDSGIEEYVQGFADWIQYDAKRESATLTGNAKMWQLVKTKVFDEIVGDKIYYDAIAETYSATSKNNVKSILSPRRNQKQNP